MQQNNTKVPHQMMHKTPHIILCYFSLNMFLYIEQKKNGHWIQDIVTEE